MVLLARAGIQTQWIHCLGHMQVPRPALCGANLESGTVMTLETHLGHPSNLGDPPGAAAVEDATRQSTPLRFANARSIIDFLLLGEKHSVSGIMRAVWGKSEYREMARRWLRFSAAERQALMRAVPTSGTVLAEVK